MPSIDSTTGRASVELTTGYGAELINDPLGVLGVDLDIGAATADAEAEIYVSALARPITMQIVRTRGHSSWRLNINISVEGFEYHP